MFQGKLLLRAYDLTSSDKPFRSETPRKPLCLYLKTSDKVTDLPTECIVGFLYILIVLTDECLATSLCALVYHPCASSGF